MLCLAAFWIGDDPRSGLSALALMAAVGMLFLAGGRSDLVRGLRGDGRDEYRERLDVHASYLAGLVTIGLIIGMCLWERAHARSGMPYVQLGAISGVAYIVAVGVLRWRPRGPRSSCSRCSWAARRSWRRAARPHLRRTSPRARLSHWMGGRSQGSSETATRMRSSRASPPTSHARCQKTTVDHVLRATLGTAPIGARTGESPLPASPAQRMYFSDHVWGTRTLALRVVLDAESAIVGIDVRPGTAVPRDPHAGDRLKTRLSLRFAASGGCSGAVRPSRRITT